MPDILDELNRVIGGNFNPASVGPEAFNALADKIRRDPAPYLDALRGTYLGDRFDPLQHAELHLAAFLSLAREAEPEAARRVVESLLRLYDGVLVPFDRVRDRSQLDTVMDEDTVNLLYRLNTRRLELRALLADWPGSPGGGNR
jgi:hypothetical protein